jgi:hypothetical protein
MRIFEKPNLSDGWKCPVCETSEEKPVTLVGIRGTEDEGLMKAEQFHVDCLDLVWDKTIGGGSGVIYQLLRKENNDTSPSTR